MLHRILIILLGCVLCYGCELDNLYLKEDLVNLSVYNIKKCEVDCSLYQDTELIQAFSLNKANDYKHIISVKGFTTYELHRCAGIAGYGGCGRFR